MEISRLPSEMDYPRPFWTWIDHTKIIKLEIFVVFYRAPGAEAFSGAESIHENVDIHVLVDRSIAIDDRRSPENLEVER